MAAIALVALIGYGVATSASTSSAPKVAPAPSTTTPAPTTTQVAPTTTVPLPVVPYYAANPPADYSVEYADIQENDIGYYGPGQYQLWATPDASAASGAWFSIEGYLGGVQSLFATNAYRIETEQSSIGVSHTTSGQTVVQFMSNRTALTVTAFGLSDEQLVSLAASISISRGEIELADPSAIGDFRLLSTVHPWFAVQGIPVEQVFYTADSNPMGGIGITVAPRPPSNEGGGTLDRQTALRFFLDHATPFEVDGHVAVAGAVIGQSVYSVATWIARDHIVTVAGSVSVPELIAVSRTVHAVSEDEWSDMQLQASRRSQDNNFDNYKETDPVPVSFGTDAAGDQWIINVGIATYGDVKMLNWQWDGNGFGSETGDTAAINTVVDGQRTYVLADLPRAISTTAQLQVTRAGFDPVLVPFADTDAGFDRTFAAYAFSEPIQYTAQIIDADGAVLATWPST